MKRKSSIVFVTQILAFLCVCNILGCSVESGSGEEKPVVATYTVSYLTDKGISTGTASLLTPVTVAEGTVISDAQLPKLSETGWSFEGWYDGETKVVAGVYKVTKSVTLVAKWTKKATQDDSSKTSYTISYFSDKGVADASLLNPITLSEGSIITAEQLPKLSADGWSFEGWYDGETRVVVGVYKVTKNVLFIAKWEKSKQGQDEPDTPAVMYTVSYSSDKGVTDANLLNPITVSEGTAITAEQLPELSATGWTFEGWYDGETKVVAGYKVTKNITLVAKWTLNPKYTVEHWLQNIDDDDYVCKQSDSQQLYGKAGTMTTANAKNYSGFVAQEIEQAVIQPDGTTVVKIKYDRKIITVTVNLDGGSLLGGYGSSITRTGKFGEKTYLNLKNPKKANCEFGGWSMDIPETFPADDIEIKALWGKYYRVSYQSEKPIDFTPETILYVEGEVLTYLPELKATGWIFEGWYDGETKAISGEYVITKDVTLVAKWLPDTVTYTVEHCQQNIEDDEYNFLVIQEQLSGKTEELTAALAKDYPGFTAQNITQTKIAADGSTVVKIYYDRKIINLTFNLDGGNIDGKTEDVVVSGKYGSDLSIKEPKKYNHTFTNWNPIVPKTFPSENTIYTAVYKKSFIIVSVRDWNSDLKISKSETDDYVYTVTIPNSYTSISYFINGEKQSETSSVYEFKIPKENGCYNLMVKAKNKNDGRWYSCSFNVVVEGIEK